MWGRNALRPYRSFAMSFPGRNALRPYHFLFSILFSLLLGCTAAPPPPHGALSLKDDAGYTVVLPRTAQRIVSLMPATTEILFALGAGPRVVGRTDWCDYPTQATAIPSVGGGISPNVEAVLARHPDLIVIYRSSGNQNAVERFRSLGVPTLEVLVDTEADFTRVTKLLGDATGTRPAADSLLTVFTARLDSATVRNPHPPTVFILAWESPPMTLGAGSFLSQIIDRAGARNLFADLEQSSAPISVEAVAARNPDFILVVTDKEPGVTRRPEWQPVRAVRERRFLRVLGSEFSRPSPRMPDAVWALRRALAAVR